jgi:hypothetical protein
MTTQADSPATEAGPAVAGAAVPQRREEPLVYLGIRRAWWVVLCLLLLVAVDVVPTVGPYLALAVLMWMVSGLARAKPRPARAVRVVRRAARPRRSTGSEQGTALSS